MTAVREKLTQSELELGLDGLCSHLLDLVGKDLSGRRSAVDTVGLDGDEDTTANLEEPVGVHGDDTGLVGLGNIGKDDIDHGDNHAVAGRLTGILNNGDDVGSLGSHGDEITAGSRRELDGVDVAGGTDKVGDVGDGGTRGTTEVEDAGAGLDVDLIGTTSDGSAKLASEGVPHAVLDLGGGGGTIVVLDRLVDRDALLAVDGLARGQVASRKTILLTAADDKDTGVAVRLLDKVLDRKTFNFDKGQDRVSTYNNDLGTALLTRLATEAAATAATTTFSDCQFQFKRVDRSHSYLEHHRGDRHGEHHGHHLLRTVSLDIQNTTATRDSAILLTSATSRTATATEAAAITTETTTASSASAATATTGASSRGERCHDIGLI